MEQIMVGIGDTIVSAESMNKIRRHLRNGCIQLLALELSQDVESWSKSDGELSDDDSGILKYFNKLLDLLGQPPFELKAFLNLNENREIDGKTYRIEVFEMQNGDWVPIVTPL